MFGSVLIPVRASLYHHKLGVLLHVLGENQAGVRSVAHVVDCSVDTSVVGLQPLSVGWQVRSHDGVEDLAADDQKSRLAGSYLHNCRSLSSAEYTSVDK